ncbi:MAG: hypothetical protein ACRDWY_05285, partial [Actinomycetes bacterium]
ADRDHVANCPACLAGLAAAQDDATVTGAALGVELTTDVDEGWRRLSGAMAADGRRRSVAAASAPRWRGALRSPVVAALGVAALVGGASAAAAADWLQIFRAEKTAPVVVTEADLVRLPDLSAYGDLEVLEKPDVRAVADAGVAEEVTGLSVPRVNELPRGVTGNPAFEVGDEASLVFTFSAEKAERVAADVGETLPTPPPGLDGSQFRLVVGPGVAMVWSSAQGLPGLFVGRAVAPTAYSSGVPFEPARDYLLSLPGLSEDLASQLRSFSGDGTTLPLPVPAELVTTSSADVDGVSATVLTSRDGTMAGVVWVDEGIVNVVAGSLSADEVLTVARGLR